MVTSQFVVFEGIDGSGTSTQAALLHERLVREGHRCVLTSEPTSGPVGNLIRQLMTRRLMFSQSEFHFDRFLAYLFAADRYDHVYNAVDGISAYLSQGIDVVSTRYYFSSLAYHVTTPEDFRIVRSLNSEFPEPDLTIYLDCPVKTALDRLRRSRQLAEHYENAEKLRCVKENYRQTFADFKGPFVSVDATLPTQEQHELVFRRLRNIIADTQK